MVFDQVNGILDDYTTYNHDDIFYFIITKYIFQCLVCIQCRRRSYDIGSYNGIV